MSFLSDILSDLPSERNPGGVTVTGLNTRLNMDSRIHYQMGQRKQINWRLWVRLS